MAGAWGVNSNGIIEFVWPVAPAGSDGDTINDLTLRLPQSNEDALDGDAGLRFDGERPAAPFVDLSTYVNNSLLSLHERILSWESDLISYGPDVYRVGTLCLDSGWQAAKIILADSTTYSHIKADKIFRAAILGALDITSPAVFADSAYALRSATAPTRAKLWVNSVGERQNLSDAIDYGSLISERPFVLPRVWRTGS